MVKEAKVTKRPPITSSERRKRLMSRRFDKMKVSGTKADGVVYIGHIPKGFNEDELRKFFEQFGPISKF